MSIKDFSKKKCISLIDKLSLMDDNMISESMKVLDGWLYESGYITKEFKFANYDETLAFFNSTAWISKIEDHHPDILITYNTCKVSYKTHAIDGISENDFICASKIDKLITM